MGRAELTANPRVPIERERSAATAPPGLRVGAAHPAASRAAGPSHDTPSRREDWEWCNDEYRHGEAFALLMRAQPQLLRGLNRYWIRFFVLAVYATMYVRDHTRPVLYEALGIDPTTFDYQVFAITTEISRQVFPLTLETDDPRFRAGLADLLVVAQASAAAKAQGGVIGSLKRAGLSVKAALLFARLYFLPTSPNQAPERVRVAPAW